jgi:hypothetical protein
MAALVALQASIIIVSYVATTTAATASDGRDVR